MPHRLSVEDLLKRRRKAVRELNSVRREFGSIGGFALHHGVKEAQKKIEAVDIRLAKLGYSPSGRPFEAYRLES